MTLKKEEEKFKTLKALVVPKTSIPDITEFLNFGPKNGHFGPKNITGGTKIQLGS